MTRLFRAAIEAVVLIGALGTLLVGICVLSGH